MSISKQTASAGPDVQRTDIEGSSNGKRKRRVAEARGITPNLRRSVSQSFTKCVNFRRVDFPCRSYRKLERVLREGSIAANGPTDRRALEGSALPRDVKQQSPRDLTISESTGLDRPRTRPAEARSKFRLISDFDRPSVI